MVMGREAMAAHSCRVSRSLRVVEGTSEARSPRGGGRPRRWESLSQRPLRRSHLRRRRHRRRADEGREGNRRLGLLGLQGSVDEEKEFIIVF